MTRLRVLWLALATALLAATPAASDAPGDYRVRIAVTPGSGSSVQRLAIPAAALAAAETPDLSDLRVFDARGRAMPIARMPAQPALRRDAMKAMPILGAADDFKARSLSLRLDDQGRARVTQVDGTVAPGTGQSVVLGALFDARAVTAAARLLTLDADVPAAQPVTFRVEASRDLAAWRALGETVAYRASAAGSVAIPLGMAALNGDYLKVTWRLESRALSPVAVRGAVLLSRPDAPAAATWAEAGLLPPSSDAHAIQFAIPFGTPIAAIRIVPKGNDLVVPVRVLGRDDREQPWALLGEGVAARPSGATAAPAAIVLHGGYRTMRIEADTRTPGFTAPPDVQLGFAASELLFLAAGEAPYTLAAGRARNADVYLRPESLMTQAGGRPAAIAMAADAPARVALADGGDARSGRQLILWAVLLLATALLAALAWLLWKRESGAASD